MSIVVYKTHRVRDVQHIIDFKINDNIKLSCGKDVAIKACLYSVCRRF